MVTTLLAGQCTTAALHDEICFTDFDDGLGQVFLSIFVMTNCVVFSDSICRFFFFLLFCMELIKNILYSMLNIIHRKITNYISAAYLFVDYRIECNNLV